MSRLVRLFALLPLLVAPAAAASDLYESTTIVTGMDARSRPEGLMRTLRQVLFKVSGNPDWQQDKRVDGIDPHQSLQSLLYLDRFTALPKHDEQGSRDRPYNLTARFDPSAIDSLLRRWGDQPWPVPRPVLAIDVIVTPRNGPPFPLRADTDVDERHRGALRAAADQTGIEIAVPAVLDPPPLPADSVTVTGRLTWSDADFGWNSTWRISVGETTKTWAGRGESFDAAYRTGLAGAAAALSKHR